MSLAEAVKVDNIRLWKLIIACHKTKSLGRACEISNLSISAASKIISAFEDSTGLMLLNRSTRPAQLTETLESLLPTAIKIVAAYEAAENSVESIIQEHQASKTRGKIVRICLPINVRNPAVLSNLLNYAQEGKNLRLEFFGDDGFRRLHKGDVDIAQMGFFINDPLFHCEYVRTNAFFILASRKFILKHGMPNDIKDLEKLPVAIRNPSNRSFSRRLIKKDQTFFLPDGSNIIYADTTTCKSLLVEGNALSLDISIGTVLEELKNGDVVPVLHGWHRKPNDTYVCCQTKNANNPIISDLMRIIKQTLVNEKEDRWEYWADKFGIDRADFTDSF